MRNAHDKHLQDCNSIIMGDFNVDFNKQSSQQHTLQKFMSESGFQQKIHEQTTDHHSTLDLIFTNVQDVQTGVLEVYYSDH